VRLRLLGAFLLLTLFVLVALEVPLAVNYHDRQLTELRNGLERDAFVLASYVQTKLAQPDAAELTTIAYNYSVETKGRVVIITASGDVLADTDPLRDGIQNFASRPEVAAALQQKVASGSRYSKSLRTGLIYVAVPVTQGNTVVGAVRLSYSTQQVEDRVHRYWWLLALAGAFTLMIASVVGILLARWVTRPLGDLSDAAREIGAGDLEARADATHGPPEVRALATSFNTTAARLGELLVAQEQFVADASHQLRTPLTALRLRLEMIEAGVEGPVVEDIEAAHSEVLRMSRLVDGLLALARAERTQQARPAPTEIGPIIAERLSVWEHIAAERSVSLVSIPTPLVALTDPDHLGQILDNYIANALEVSPAGSSVLIRAAIEVQGDERFAAVHVADQGPGMDAEQRAHAFDRFWRAGTTRTELGGSGLGLAIVRKLAEADGGRAELRAAPGGGLDAVVLLPV
jgi:signal transduction histidine kinase